MRLRFFLLPISIHTIVTSDEAYWENAKCRIRDPSLAPWRFEARY